METLVVLNSPLPERHFALRTTDSAAKGESNSPDIAGRTHAA